MFYKFLHTADIEYVLREHTIKLSSLKYFRDLEDKQPWIGDRLEGSTKLTTPPSLTVTEGSPELEMVNRANIGLGRFKEGFAKVTGGRIEMGGATFVHQVPRMHIFSYSHGGIEKLKTAMCIDACDPYSACLSINDHEALLKAIWNDGEILETKTLVKQAFKTAGWAEVSYSEVERDITAGPVIVPSPFKKALRFASQCEYRYAFVPAMDSIPERITVKVPNLSDHFQEVFRDLNTQTSS